MWLGILVMGVCVVGLVVWLVWAMKKDKAE
jgi:hypothetical protein